MAKHKEREKKSMKQKYTRKRRKHTKQLRKHTKRRRKYTKRDKKQDKKQKGGVAMETAVVSGVGFLGGILTKLAFMIILIGATLGINRMDAETFLFGRFFERSCPQGQKHTKERGEPSDDGVRYKICIENKMYNIFMKYTTLQYAALHYTILH